MPHVPTEVRRQQFIDAAVSVIARVGVDGATTRRIADEAGAPLATLHYCFQTKENLLWAVFEHLAEVVRSSLEATRPEAQDLASIARQLLNETLHLAMANPDANRAQLEIWLWVERNDPEVALRQYDTYIGLLKDFLRGAQPALPEERIETVARIVLALVDGLNMQWISHGEESLIVREIATAQAMLDGYLSAESSLIQTT